MKTKFSLDHRWPVEHINLIWLNNSPQLQRWNISFCAGSGKHLYLQLDIDLKVMIQVVMIMTYELRRWWHTEMHSRYWGQVGSKVIHYIHTWGVSWDGTGVFSNLQQHAVSSGGHSLRTGLNAFLLFSLFSCLSCYVNENDWCCVVEWELLYQISHHMHVNVKYMLVN